MFSLVEHSSPCMPATVCRLTDVLVDPLMHAVSFRLWVLKLKICNISVGDASCQPHPYPFSWAGYGPGAWCLC